MADQASVTNHTSAPQSPPPHEPASPEPVSQKSLLQRAIGSRRAGLLAAGALALIGLIFAWQASRLDLGQIGLPGPGFFPLVFIARVSLLFAVVSSAVGMAACWYLFGELLGVRLPTGPF